MSYYPSLCVLVCLSTFYYEIGKLRAISVLIDMVVASVSLFLFYYFKYCELSMRLISKRIPIGVGVGAGMTIFVFAIIVNYTHLV